MNWNSCFTKRTPSTLCRRHFGIYRFSNTYARETNESNLIIPKDICVSFSEYFLLQVLIPEGKANKCHFSVFFRSGDGGVFESQNWILFVVTPVFENKPSPFLCAIVCGGKHTYRKRLGSVRIPDNDKMFCARWHRRHRCVRFYVLMNNT